MVRCFSVHIFHESIVNHREARSFCITLEKLNTVYHVENWILFVSLCMCLCDIKNILVSNERLSMNQWNWNKKKKNTENNSYRFIFEMDYFYYFFVYRQ